MPVRKVLSTPEGPVNEVGPNQYLLVLGAGAACVAAGCVFFAINRYRISKPEEYLVRTGLGIEDMLVSRKGFVWPFQQYSFISMHPRTYQFNMHNMSREKIEFNLPVVFTVSPVSPKVDMDGFKRYAQMMNDLPPHEIESIVRGVVEGETRGLTANLTVEEMFNSKEKFKDDVVSKIQEDLDKLGLHVLNANIKEMSDYDEHNKYFMYRRQRALEAANYETLVQNAEAKRKGDIGVKENERATRVQNAAKDADAVIQENERQAEIARSRATLEEAQAESRRRSESANINATMFTRLRETELQSEIEVKRQAQLLEQLRADDLTHTRVEAEQSVAQAEGKAQSIRIVADAHFYEEQKRAEAIQITLQAHSEGLASIMKACEGDSATARFYLGLKEGIYEKLAEQQAAAVTGMQPKISVWNTGPQAGDSDPLGPVLRSVQSIAPMLDGLHKHSDFKLPTWLVQQTEDNKSTTAPSTTPAIKE